MSTEYEKKLETDNEKLRKELAEAHAMVDAYKPLVDALPLFKMMLTEEWLIESVRDRATGDLIYTGSEINDMVEAIWRKAKRETNG